MVCSSDVEDQRRGGIALSFESRKVLAGVETSQKNRRYHQNRVASHTAAFTDAIPLRCIAIHGCLPDQLIYRILVPIYGMALGAALSSKVKIHMGELTEYKYQLKSYGIPVELIPVTDTGNIKLANFKQWLKLRRRLELLESSGESWPLSLAGNQQQQQPQQQQPQRPTSVIDYLRGNDFRWSSQDGSIGYNLAEQRRLQHRGNKHLAMKNLVVECPGSNDVLFRRGNAMRCHPGNVMFKSIIESRLDEHSDADPDGKLRIEFDIMHFVLNVKGGRFLTWDSEGWWSDMLSDNGDESTDRRFERNAEAAELTFNNLQEVAGVATASAHAAAFEPIDTNNQLLEIQSKVHYAFRDFAKKIKKKNIPVSSSSTYLFERQQDEMNYSKRTRRDGCGIRSMCDGDV